MIGRVWRWLLGEPEQLPPVYAGRGYATDEHDARVRAEAYQRGRAEGEIYGRLALADEIVAELNSPMTASDAQRIRQRQVH